MDEELEAARATIRSERRLLLGVLGALVAVAVSAATAALLARLPPPPCALDPSVPQAGLRVVPLRADANTRAPPWSRAAVGLRDGPLDGEVWVELEGRWIPLAGRCAGG